MAPNNRRNEPCPCGSGRKYKRCCWAKDAAATAAASASSRASGSGPASSRELHPYTRRDRERAIERLVRFIGGRDFDEARTVAAEVFWSGRPEWASDEEYDAVIASENGAMAFHPWLMYDFEWQRRETLLDLYLSRHGDALGAGERSYLDAMRTSQVRLYEIVAVRLDEGFDLRDLETDHVVPVRERAATHQLVVWDVLAARLAPAPEGATFIENVHAWFGADAKGELERALRRARREQAKGPRAGDDIGFWRVFSVFVSDLWVSRVALPPLPVITTTDGEPVAFVRAVFDVADPAALHGLLDASDDLSADDDRRYTWLDGSRVLGTFTLDGARLTFEGMSEARAERAREFVATLAGRIVAHRLTRVQDATAALREERQSTRVRRAPRPGLTGEEGGRVREGKRRRTRDLPFEVEAAILAEMNDRHYLEWPDIPLPALDGRTPRHAARLKTQRPRVVALLKSFEASAARERLAGRPAYDFRWLWTELGLERPGGGN